MRSAHDEQNRSTTSAEVQRKKNFASGYSNPTNGVFYVTSEPPQVMLFIEISGNKHRRQKRWSRTLGHCQGGTCAREGQPEGRSKSKEIDVISHLLSWIVQGDGRGVVTLDLLNCTEVCSVASPTHPSA